MAGTLAFVVGVPAVAAERYEDATGDALGNAQDIIGVVVDEPEGPVLSYSVELGPRPPTDDGEGHTDILWIAFDTTPEVSFPELDGFSMASLGVTRESPLDARGHLNVGTELYWHVVDIAIEGSAVTFRLDRKLLGDPSELYFRVYSAALDGSLYTEQVDHFPEEDQPPARYAMKTELD